MLRTLPLDNPRILDLGCATGWMTNRLTELGLTEGLELSDTAVAIARAQFPGLRFRVGDLYNTPLSSDPVDVVVCQEVIAHVDDQGGLVEQIADAMKPGGYLAITAANKFVMDRLEHPPDPKEHIKKWLSMKALKHLLRPHFEVLRTTSIIPMGDRGVLRFVNSYKVNRMVGWVVQPRRLDAFKERLGLGYSIIALAQKRPVLGHRARTATGESPFGDEL